MYERIGSVDHTTIEGLRALAETATWKLVLGSGRDYQTAYVETDQLPWDDVHATFFLKIPPGGKVHKHIDVDHPWKTYHIVVETNDKAINYMAGTPYKLEVGGIYSVDRQVEHWSTNEGDTDRIHLLAEVYD